jgi:hypothetical protein
LQHWVSYAIKTTKLLETHTLDSLKYPIGQVAIPSNITTHHIDKWLQILEDFPQKLSKLVHNLNESQLDTRYRKGGWTVRQVVHHLADSHHHSYIRFKWALTEDKPVIKAYFEQHWAELHDAKSAPILLSLNALASTHAKLVYFLKGLSKEELQQSFIHPETNDEVPLHNNVGIYAWHSLHHYAHIENLIKREKWV